MGEFALVVKMEQACVETKRKGSARTRSPLMDLSFPFLLGHAQSRSMNDISLTPNTDQVENPCPWLQQRARAGRSLWF